MPYLECGSGEWLQLLLLSLALSCVCVVLPVGLFTYLLYRFRGRLDEPKVMAQLGFLYESYRRDVYWWELVGLVRRLLLSLVLSLFGRGTVLFSTSAVGVLCVSAAVQAQWAPFHTKRENMLELFAILLVTCTFQGSQYVSSWGDLDSVADWSVEIGLLVVNGIYLVVLLALFGQELRAECQPHAKRYYGRFLRMGTRLKSAASTMLGGIQNTV